MTHERMRGLLLTKLPPPIVDRFFLNGKRAGWHERNFEGSLRNYNSWLGASPVNYCLLWCETALVDLGFCWYFAPEGDTFWRAVHDCLRDGRYGAFPSVKGLPT